MYRYQIINVDVSIKTIQVIMYRRRLTVSQLHNSITDLQQTVKMQEKIPMNTAIDNYTCEERLTVYGGKSELMKRLNSKTYKFTNKNTDNTHLMLHCHQLRTNSNGREVPRYSNETECPSCLETRVLC